MTIHRDSSMNTDGPSKTKLIQHGKNGTLDIPMAPSAPSTEWQPPGQPVARAGDCSSGVPVRHASARPTLTLLP